MPDWLVPLAEQYTVGFIVFLLMMIPLQILLASVRYYKALVYKQQSILLQVLGVEGASTVFDPKNIDNEPLFSASVGGD